MYFLKPDTTMKKIVYAGLALGLMTVVSCQKELTEGQMENTVAQITKTMYVEGNEWIPEADTRTAYEPGVGIDWTGNETFAIYYGNSADSDATEENGKKYMQLASDVKALGNGLYSFSHPEIEGAQTYDYSVITPSIVTTGVQGQGLSATFKLSPVQTPGANTYDPNYDILFGQGAFGVAPAEELEITKFKRLTAPLRLSLSDGAGVIGDEKIHAATISFSQAAAGQNGFAGTLYLNFGYEYEDCKVNSFTAPSSSVTAVYAEGLSKDGSIWPVWYSVHPATFDAGGELTVTVTTETKTVSRTITLASAASIQADILNDLSFDISGEGYTEAESLYWDFTALESLSSQLTASDGNQYGWGLTGCSIWNGNDPSGKLPSALRANAGKGQITLPSIAGKQVSRIRLYAHPNNTTSKNTVSLNGAAGLDFNSYAVNTDTGNSGVLEITVPEDQYGQPLILTAGSNFAAFDGIGVELVEGAALPEADENDYYDLFTKGYDIEINGEVYNNSGYTARLIKATELEQSDLQADATTAGILFIDPEGQTEPFSSTAMAPGTSERVVLIGRYKDHQPQLQFTAQYALRCDAVFKNLHLIPQHKEGFVRTNYTDNTEQFSLTVEDCFVDMTASRYLAYDQAPTYSFKGVYINNSVVEFSSTATNNPSLFGFSTNASKTAYGPTDITVTNSVIYSAATIQAYIVNMGDGSQDKYDTYNANLNVSNNTFYNIWQKNILVRGQVFQNFTVDKNVAGYVSGDVPNAISYLACAYKSAAASSISGNYLYSGVEAAPWTVVHGKSAIEAGADNVNDAAAAPFTSENIETGYFPINTSVVTNGAGADYDTKYWIRK